MLKRIAFTGASGTGKTTLAKWISSTYDLPLNPIGSRSVAMSMGFKNPYDVDAAGKRAEFQEKLLQGKTRWEQEHDRFVVDRTTLDNLAYSVLHGVLAITDEYWAVAISGLDRYDAIVYCPVDTFCNISDDPNRIADPGYHKAYDMTLYGALKRYVKSTTLLWTLRTTSSESRKEELRWFLERYSG